MQAAKLGMDQEEAMETIYVMGPGCPKCSKTYDIVMDAVTETGVAAQVEKVSDFQAMAKLGIFSVPAVAIGKTVMSLGKVPSKADVLSWLQQHGNV